MLLGCPRRLRAQNTDLRIGKQAPS